MRFIFAQLKAVTSVMGWFLLADTFDDIHKITKASILKLKSDPHLKSYPELAAVYDNLETGAEKSFNTLRKSGLVSVNEVGGMSHASNWNILYEKSLSDFPKKPLQPSCFALGIHWYIGNKKFDTREEALAFVEPKK